MKRKEIGSDRLNKDFLTHPRVTCEDLKLQRRKARKMLVERKRRERIERSYEDLKGILYANNVSNDVVEKADILESTVLLLQRLTAPKAGGSNPHAVHSGVFHTSCDDSSSRRPLSKSSKHQRQPFAAGGGGSGVAGDGGGSDAVGSGSVGISGSGVVNTSAVATISSVSEVHAGAGFLGAEYNHFQQKSQQFRHTLQQKPQQLKSQQLLVNISLRKQQHQRQTHQQPQQHRQQQQQQQHHLPHEIQCTTIHHSLTSKLPSNYQYRTSFKPYTASTPIFQKLHYYSSNHKPHHHSSINQPYHFSSNQSLSHPPIMPPNNQNNPSDFLSPPPLLSCRSTEPGIEDSAYFSFNLNNNMDDDKENNNNINNTNNKDSINNHGEKHNDTINDDDIINNSINDTTDGDSSSSSSNNNNNNNNNNLKNNSNNSGFMNLSQGTLPLEDSTGNRENIQMLSKIKKLKLTSKKMKITSHNHESDINKNNSKNKTNNINTRNNKNKTDNTENNTNNTENKERPTKKKSKYETEAVWRPF